MKEFIISTNRILNVSAGQEWISSLVHRLGETRYLKQNVPARLYLAALLILTFVAVSIHQFSPFRTQSYDSILDPLPSLIAVSGVDWTAYAYTQYVTNEDYLCNSLMIFESLQRLGSRSDRVMMYPESLLPNPTQKEGTNHAERLLVKARDVYSVKLVPVTVQARSGVGDTTWAESYTKLLAFNQTAYKRVINVDSDSTILHAMDELFLLPPCPVAMPRAYWLLPDTAILSSQIMVVQPSQAEFARIEAKIQSAGENEYDMEIVNDLYLDHALILPHRPYNLLSGEFRADDHAKYLGGDAGADWDPAAVLREAKFVHFSDWPVPKPWLPTPWEIHEQNQPKCVEKSNGGSDCSARDIWNGLYSDFRSRREVS
jgi:alpha-N-acetylglucosamine transferase